MTRSATLAQWVVRLTGFVQIVLGVAFWPGRLLTLIPLHIASGLLLVVALWTMAVLAWRAGVNLGFVIVVLLWGLMLPIFGLTQDQILTGDLHWVIRVVHLLVGLAAIGQSQGLELRMRPGAAPAVAG